MCNKLLINNLDLRDQEMVENILNYLSANNLPNTEIESIKNDLIRLGLSSYNDGKGLSAIIGDDSSEFCGNILKNYKNAKTPKLFTFINSIILQLILFGVIEFFFLCEPFYLSIWIAIFLLFIATSYLNILSHTKLWRYPKYMRILINVIYTAGSLLCFMLLLTLLHSNINIIIPSSFIPYFMIILVIIGTLNNIYYRFFVSK